MTPAHASFAKAFGAAGALADELPWWGWVDSRVLLTPAGSLLTLAAWTAWPVEGRSGDDLDADVRRWAKALGQLPADCRLQLYALRRPCAAPPVPDGAGFPEVAWAWREREVARRSAEIGVYLAWCLDARLEGSHGRGWAGWRRNGRGDGFREAAVSGAAARLRQVVGTQVGLLGGPEAALVLDAEAATGVLAELANRPGTPAPRALQGAASRGGWRCRTWRRGRDGWRSAARAPRCIRSPSPRRKPGATCCDRCSISTARGRGTGSGGRWRPRRRGRASARRGAITTRSAGAPTPTPASSKAPIWPSRTKGRPSRRGAWARRCASSKRKAWPTANWLAGCRCTARRTSWRAARRTWPAWSPGWRRSPCARPTEPPPSGSRGCPGSRAAGSCGGCSSAPRWRRPWRRCGPTRRVTTVARIWARRLWRRWRPPPGGASAGISSKAPTWATRWCWEPPAAARASCSISCSSRRCATRRACACWISAAATGR